MFRKFLNSFALIIFSGILGLSCAHFANSKIKKSDTVRMAFGSCLHQDKEARIWSAILKEHPDFFILLGDNIYHDTKNAEEKRPSYEKLLASSAFQAIRKQSTLLATWDDHDYGDNDSGADYPTQLQSEKLFEEFFKFSLKAEAMEREGIYQVQTFGELGRQLQIILLDTRFFKSPLVKAPENHPEKWKFIPNSDSQAKLLGEAQWLWLERELQKPADVRILVSSMELNGIEHGFESWSKYPFERKRLFELIKKTKAAGVIVISGDRHRAAISKNDVESPYPLYEVTSSTLNNPLPSHFRTFEKNRYRLEKEQYYDENFGSIEVNWATRTVQLFLKDIQGKTISQVSVELDMLKSN